jgi:hypothetical protein
MVVASDTLRPQESWLTNLSLDFMSDVLIHTSILNFTSTYMSLGPTNYTTGMLTLAYHATWSAMRKKWDFETEQPSVRISEEVVQAVINRRRLLIWLVMNAALTVSAFMVWIGLRVCKVKAVRDTTLAALTMDLRDVMHREETLGLCGAVALNSQDRKLGLLKRKECREEPLEKQTCCSNALEILE